ncbi:MAG: glutamyl-tRNA reductase [Chloroflexota bacterium]|nr:glutamyl-tRNA reductase [Candidatus Sulfotelmatobacter sp.]
MHSSVANFDIVNVRITHKVADVPLLEAVAFDNKGNAMNEIKSLGYADECVLLQTCNRLEFYLVNKDGKHTAEMMKQYLEKRAGDKAYDLSKAIEVEMNEDALRHILRVAAGLESMVVGEDQILNQLWNAFLEAETAKTVGPVLRHIFNKASSVGLRVRNETGISKGAISIGSVAVELAGTLMGGFAGKHVLVMGAGQMGTLVAKALSRRSQSAIFIASRTYERAVRLAEQLCSKAVKFDKLSETLKNADVVICSTAAPHYLLTKDIVQNVMNQRQNTSKLFVIDISNPRNVETSIQEIPNVELYNLDDLQTIADRNKEERHKNAEAASKIVEQELLLLMRDVKSQSVRDIISMLLSHTEEIRQRELTRAYGMLPNVDQREKEIIDDLTLVLLKQTFLPIIQNLRKAAVENDKEFIDTAVKLFETEAH